MNVSSSENHRVREIAEIIRRDILKRALASGEAYLTAAEAGQMLGVSQMMANRAMNILAQTNILVRRRRSGTFVGPGVAREQATLRTKIHYYCVSTDEEDRAFELGRMLRGLRQSIPSARLELHQMEAHDSVSVIRAEIEQLATDKSFGGIVLSMGTRELQEMVAATGIPAVMHGSVFPGIRLPSVEVDQRGVGRLMVERAMRMSARRFVVLNRELWRHGDTLVFEGITEAVHAAGLSPGALHLRNLPSADRPAATRIIEDLIRQEFQHSDEPLGILCRASGSAHLLYQLFEKLDESYRQRSRVVYCQVPHWAYRPLPTLCVGSAVSVEEEFAAIGRVLTQALNHEEGSPESILLSVAAFPPIHSDHPTRREAKCHATSNEH